eukprot:4405658-Amphidinium_carterae.2
MLIIEEHEPVYQIILHFAQHLVPSLFTHHFRAVPISATLPLAHAVQMVVEQICCNRSPTPFCKIGNYA